MKISDHTKLLLAYVLFLLLIIVSHSGCYSSKKASKQMDKAISKYPVLAAEKTRDRFPCTDGKIDTVVTTNYELLEVECPGDTTLILDTVTNEVIRTIIKPGKTVYKESPVKTITRTVKVEDSAKVYLAQADRDHAIKERDEYKRSAKKWKEAALVVGLFLLLAILFIIVLIKRK
jgi:Ca2+/H+ antiporter